MKRIAAVVAASLMWIVSSEPAQAVPLRYKWKRGSTYRFDAQSNDAVDMSGMGMSIKSKFNTNTRFAIKIDKVRKNGVAAGTLIIESFKVVSDDGRTMAGLDSIPKGALKNLVEIDAKGNFRFKEIVYLVVDQESGTNMLVSSTVGPNEASTTAQMGDEQVTVYAQFDPNTGQLSGGYSIKKIGKKKKKKVAVKQDATRVDILPTQFMEMLKLPEGDVTGGGTFEAAVGLMASTKVTVTAEEVTAKSARLRTRVKTDVDTTEVAAAADDDAGGGMPGMGGIPGMGGMPGMGGVPGMGGGSGGAAGGTTVKMDGDFTAVFAVSEGMLDSIEGVISTSTSAGGVMKIDSTSTLKMTRVK